MGLAQKLIGQQTTAGFDEEDVVLSEFNSFCSAVQNGRYDINDRDELWRVLAVITVNKARNRLRDENRLRRGGGMKRNPSSVLQRLTCPEPDAAINLIMHEECERLLAKLERPEVQIVALLKVQGYTNEQIADQLDCSRRSVQRRLDIIRKLWRSHGTEDTNQ